MRGAGRILAVLVVATAAARAAAAMRIERPWITPDETIYALLGRGLWEHGHLAVLGGPTPFYSAAYPALVGVALGAGGIDGGRDALQVVQAALLSATAVPVYLWARAVARPPWALAAAAATLALPGLVYAGTLMTEALFVPLATLASWAAFRALVAPTPRRQALLVAALVLCFATRLETNVVALGLVAAAVASGRVRALAPTWIALGVVAATWLVFHSGNILGGYTAATSGYAVPHAAAYVGYHVAVLALAAGIVPAAALVALTPETTLRPLVALAWATAAVAVVEVGVFASAHAGHLTERTLVFALPPLFVAFAAWLDRGAPRARIAAVAAAATVLAALVPWHDLVAVQDDPTFVHASRIGVVVAALVAAALVLTRARAATAIAVCAALAVCSVAAARDFARASRATGTLPAGAESRWVDEAARAPVAFLYDGDPAWNLVWSQAYWNRRIETVLDAPGAHVPGPLPQRELRRLGVDGALRRADGEPVPRLVAASAWIQLRGTALARTDLGEPSQSPSLVLWRLDGRPRVDTVTTGVSPNGDVAVRGTVTVFDCTLGTFELTAVGKADETMTLERDGKIVARKHVGDGESWSTSIRTPTAPTRRCTFVVSADNTLGTTVFHWVRAT